LAIAQNPTKQQADYAYNTKGYSSSVVLYESIGSGSLNASAKLRLADSYRLNGNTEAAERWYAEAIEESSTKDILHYAQMLQSNGKCEEAIERYTEYLNLVGGEAATPRANIKDCADLNIKASNKAVVTNVEVLNSGHLEFSPVPYQGGILFTSTRGAASSNAIDQWTNDNFTDLFFAERGEVGLKAPILLKGNINQEFHDGTATFNKSGKKMYFTRNSEGKNSKEVVDLKIYSADLVDGEWTNIKALVFNNNEYATCHPTLSKDGRKLYFASNRPGGMGGMDLYVAHKRGEGWSRPKNLGPTINTGGNEIFPFINHQEELFFASDGHQGLGGLDVYVAQEEDNDWVQVNNLGAPYNSRKDDFGFSILANGKEGYFSSNRAGGLGGDDIYHWEADNLETNALRNTNAISVIDEATGEKIPEALISIELANGEADNSLISYMTDELGSVQPTFATDQSYTIGVNKPGYTTYKKVVSAYELKKAAEWVVALNRKEGKVLSGEVINKKYDKAIPNAVINLFNFCTGENEKVLSDSEGKFTFFLDCNCDFEITGEKERFSKDKKTISTINTDCENTHSINTSLYLNIGSAPISRTTSSVPTTSSSSPRRVVTPTPPPTRNISTASSGNTIRNLSDLSIDDSSINAGDIITLDNLYYDYNKFFVRADAAKELNTVIDLMRKYPTMELELSSHTDSRGRKGYNQTLSQKRAEVAVNYLVAKGISRTRLIARGFGEERLRNHCADNEYCSEEEHQENRRTEIKVVKR